MVKVPAAAGVVDTIDQRLQGEGTSGSDGPQGNPDGRQGLAQRTVVEFPAIRPVSADRADEIAGFASAPAAGTLFRSDHMCPSA